MDFRFTDEEERFKAEILDWVRTELPSEWDGMDREDQFSAENWPTTQVVAKKLAAKGWLTNAWPKEYNGQGRSNIEQTIFQDEMMFHGVPGTTMGVSGTQWVGPALMISGSDEQKSEHLSRIASGDAWWCTGYSEPGTGSDLASLQTRAVRDGDDYVVKGQKIWTSAAHIADWCWLAVRTDPEAPKHKGISMLLVDMQSPGVEVRPIINMADGHSFNEVHFDDVRVPARNRVGEENQGWYILAVALDFERSGVTYASYARKTLGYIEQFAAAAQRSGRPLRQDPIVRNLLGDLAIQVQIQRHFAYRVAWLQQHKEVFNREASVAKVWGSETQQRVALGGMRILGLQGQLEDDSPAHPWRARIERQYLLSVSVTIAAGSSEVQRNIIAQRGLGLPRG